MKILTSSVTRGQPPLFDQVSCCERLLPERAESHIPVPAARWSDDANTMGKWCSSLSQWSSLRGHATEARHTESLALGIQFAALSKVLLSSFTLQTVGRRTSVTDIARASVGLMSEIKQNCGARFSCLQFSNLCVCSRGL